MFDVWVDGSLVVDSLDMFSEIGDQTPLTVHFTPMVTDGFATIELSPIVQNPKITGIEIFDINNDTHQRTLRLSVQHRPRFSLAPSVFLAPTATPMWNDIYTNCGGTDYTTVSSHATWMGVRPVLHWASVHESVYCPYFG